jgi:hypothetical protein
MKTFCKATMIALFVFLFINEIQAQTTQTKLNQVELMKQFIGTWKGEVGKDTTFIMKGKSLWKGLEFYWKTETKAKILSEGKSIMGYDKTNDRIIESQIWNYSRNIILWSGLFSTANKYEAILLKEISTPEKATEKWEYEFKDTDMLKCTYTINGNTIGIYNLNRENK